MAIFNSYVSLPEGKLIDVGTTNSIFLHEDVNHVWIKHKLSDDVYQRELFGTLGISRCIFLKETKTVN